MIGKNELRVLVVDDSALYRKIATEILREIDDVMVVGTAQTGKEALSKLQIAKPDLLLLDVEMPEMTGIEVLKYIKLYNLTVGAIMLSSHTYKGGRLTLKALELGAFDFIPKPLTGDIDENKTTIKNMLAPMLAAYAGNKKFNTPISRSSGAAVSKMATVKHVPRTIDLPKKSPFCQAEIVAIGISTGGPQALSQIVQEIPDTFSLPIVIVQHMPPIFTKEFAKQLNKKCSSYTIKEAEDTEKIVKNTMYIAPGGKQMMVTNGFGHNGRRIRITDDRPENCCKPSVDFLFRSIADQYGTNALGVIMTGMGTDGMLGLRLMKRQGASILAQDEASCTVYGMPKGPIEAGIVDLVVPLDMMVETICRVIRFPWNKAKTASK